MNLGPSITPLSSLDFEPLQLKRQLSKEDLGGKNNDKNNVNVLMIGTGEYTTGFVNGKASSSDKSTGIVALTMFDLRSRCKVNRIGMVGVNGLKFPCIREHLQNVIGNVYGLDTTVDTFPKDHEVNPKSYVDALSSFSSGDIAIIFTPDDTHFEIALEAISRGIHVLITKPAVKNLEHHRILHEASIKHNVLVAIEVHKRWDPIYIDAKDKIKDLGQFSYIYSYMSQPKHQLDTFRCWAGKSSDISYYLNSHHIDFHEWVVGETSRPIRVTAIASSGLAHDQFNIDCEDTITLTVQWENLSIIKPLSTTPSSSLVVVDNSKDDIQVTGYGTAIYTSSWIAPISDVHSQQRFFYMGHKGEVNVDQAHRGYNMSVDHTGYRSVNPLFMKFTPTNGKFTGQSGYGYRSFEVFIDAVTSINNGTSNISDYSESLASISNTYRTTAILEAGRLSLDHKRTIEIKYEDNSNPYIPTILHII